MPLGPARGRGTEPLRAGAAQGGPAAALSRNAGLGLGASFASRRAARCGKSTAGRSALRLWPCGRGRVGSVPLPELWSAAPFVSARRSLRFFPGGLVKASEPSLLRVGGGGAMRCDLTPGGRAAPRAAAAVWISRPLRRSGCRWRTRVMRPCRVSCERLFAALP